MAAIGRSEEGRSGSQEPHREIAKADRSIADERPEAGPGIVAAVDAPPEAELIFLPTDASGRPGQLNTSILKRLGLPVEIPTRTLGQGYSLRKSPLGRICFVVTVGRGKTEELLTRNFARAILDSDVAGARSYWVPLMGTGEGALAYEDSFRILFDQLSRFEPIADGRSRAVIALPPDIPAAALSRITALTAAFGARSGPAASPAPATAAQTAVDADLEAAPAPSSSAKPYPLPHSDALNALLELASALALIPAAQGTVVSTSLLFLALAESQTPVAVEQLRRDVASRYSQWRSKTCAVNGMRPCGWTISAGMAGRRAWPTGRSRPAQTSATCSAMRTGSQAAVMPSSRPTI